MFKHAQHFLQGLGAILLLSFFATPSLAAPGDFLTPELVANETPILAPDGSDIASDADGNLLVVWLESRQIMGRRLAADGTPLSGTLTLVDDANHLGAQGLAMAPNGDFVITFRRNLFAAHHGVYAQRFDALGNRVGRELTVNLPHLAQSNRTLAITLSLGGALQRREMTPAVGMDADGNFNIVWEQEVDLSLNNQQGNLLNKVRTRISLQRFDAKGRRIGLIRSLAEGTTPLLITQFPLSPDTGLVGNPRIAVQNNGDFAVAWQRSRLTPDAGDPPSTRATDIEFRAFRASGLGRGATRALVAEAAQADLQDLAAVNGEYLAAWDQGALANLQQINDLGEPTGTLFSVTGGGSALAVAPGGSAVWTWIEGAAGTDQDLQTQLLSVSGAMAGSPFRVHAASTRRQFAPRAAADAEGNFAIGWADAPVGTSIDHHFRARRVEGF